MVIANITDRDHPQRYAMKSGNIKDDVYGGGFDYPTPVNSPLPYVEPYYLSNFLEQYTQGYLLPSLRTESIPEYALQSSGLS